MIVDGLGDAARDENLAALARRGHWISLGQASGALQPIAADALVHEVDRPSRARSVFDYVATHAQRWPSARSASGRRSPTARCRRRRSSAIALDAAAEAHARLESRAHASARWS